MLFCDNTVIKFEVELKLISNTLVIPLLDSELLLSVPDQATMCPQAWVGSEGPLIL